MSIFGIAVLAAFCGIVMVQGDPTLKVNVEKVTISEKDNPYSESFTATLNPGSPQNTVTFEFQMKKDLPENTMLKFIATVSGQEFPPVETTLCKGLIEETIGKPLVAKARAPFPKSCPFIKGSYVIPKYSVDTSKISTPLPSGKFTAILQVYVRGEEPFLTATAEGAISRDVLG